jgi:uncharacterized RDD family membrane protein YckC
MKTNALLIRTPEGIVFSQLLAGPVLRFLAWLIDLVCVLALVILMSQCVAVLLFISPGLASALSIVGYFVISVGYAMACEWLWRGQTVGKRVCRLRVMDA